ncbi:MAG: hypothetical protein GW946_03210 [Candidatus Pacebacteria bacterium]|nr:hypothetical protein [Candidatus Paceibacterota bacterium]
MPLEERHFFKRPDLLQKAKPREKSARHRESERLHREKRKATQRTAENRSRTQAFILQEAMRDAFTGEAEYARDLNEEARIENDLGEVLDPDANTALAEWRAIQDEEDRIEQEKKEAAEKQRKDNQAAGEEVATNSFEVSAQENQSTGLNRTIEQEVALDAARKLLFDDPRHRNPNGKRSVHIV